MPWIGAGVYEIRIYAHGAYRVFYVVIFEEAIYVLHAFQKKTKKTAKRDIEIGQQRYKTAQESQGRKDRARQ
jgi:phage-related protein